MFQGLTEKIGVDRVVFALSLARMGDAIGNSLLFVVIPLYVARLPADWFPFSEPVRVGVLISLYGFISAVCEPIIGALIDRFGRRKLMIQLGLLIMAGSLVAFIPVDRYAWLVLLRCAQALGLAITVPATLALMAVVTRTETRGRAMGFYSAMRMLGMALGPLLGGFLEVRYGFTTTFLAGAGCIALAILFVQIWVSDPDPPRDRPGRQTRHDEPGFFNRRIWSAGVVGSAVAMACMSCAFTMMVTLEKQFNGRLHIDPFLFALAFSSLTLSRLIFQVPLGYVFDRCGRKPVILVGLLVLAPATALLGCAGTLWELVVLRIIQGVASAGVAAPAFALAADSARSGSHGRQMSITTVGFSVGMAIGPLLAGILVLYFFALPFVGGAVLCLAGAAVVFRFAPETIHHAGKKCGPEEFLAG